MREAHPPCHLVNDQPLDHGVAGQSRNWGMRVRWRSLSVGERSVRALRVLPSVEYGNLSEVLPSVLAPL